MSRCISSNGVLVALIWPAAYLYTHARTGADRGRHLLSGLFRQFLAWRSARHDRRLIQLDNPPQIPSQA